MADMSVNSRSASSQFGTSLTEKLTIIHINGTV